MSDNSKLATNDLEIAEMLLDAAYRMQAFPWAWYEGPGPGQLEAVYYRAMYGDPED